MGGAEKQLCGGGGLRRDVHRGASDDVFQKGAATRGAHQQIRRGHEAAGQVKGIAAQSVRRRLRERGKATAGVIHAAYGHRYIGHRAIGGVLPRCHHLSCYWRGAAAQRPIGRIDSAIEQETHRGRHAVPAPAATTTRQPDARDKGASH